MYEQALSLKLKPTKSSRGLVGSCIVCMNLHA